MSRHFKIITSNRTEILLEEFKKNLIPNSHPFTRRIAIVPSAAMKSWVSLQLAQDPTFGIASFIDSGFVEPTLNKLYNLLVTNQVDTSCEPSELELAFAIESEIVKLINSNLSAKERETLHPLLMYIGADGYGKIGKRSIKRAVSLADHLAKSFLQYGLYGNALLPALANDEGWQQHLWQKIELLFAKWNYPYRKFGHVTLTDEYSGNDLQIHVFGLSYIAPIHHRFLLKIAEKVPVTYYLLSPCQKFWSDLLSDKERMKMMKFWEKEGISDLRYCALDHFLREANPLLANFGRLGREMALMVEAHDPFLLGRYALPQSVQEAEAYQELIDDEVEWVQQPSAITLLEAVQADIALLRTPSQETKLPFSSYDSTIQLHAAPRPYREVEVVRDVIMSILDKHKNDPSPITPGDIVVMASNLAAYEPYIRTVFEEGEAPLEIQLMDVKIPSDNPLIAAFLHLLSIPFSRWDAATLLHLFSFEAFQRRHRLSQEEVGDIAEWIKKCRIRWGGDLTHRNEMIEGDHGVKCSNISHGTWEQGIEALLDSLLYGKSPDLKVDPSQGELIGNLIHLLRSLREDMMPLTQSTMMSIEEWVQYLSCLCDGYLQPKGEEEEGGREILSQQFQTIIRAGKKLEGSLFPFRSIKGRLENALRSQTTIYKESNLNAVRFCSLLPMRAVPAKAIILMGMGDGEFPRQEKQLSINLLAATSGTDYSPSQGEFDRYLFLEALLSARRYFIMTYTYLSPGENQELLPSMLASELIEYIDKAYKIASGSWVDALSVGKRCQFRHPFDGFNESYYTAGSPLKSYSKSNYKAARALYDPEKRAEHSFIQDFAFSENNQNQCDGEVNLPLKDLSAFAKNPIKTYCNKTLDLYIQSKEDRQLKQEEDLLLTRIDFSTWLKEAIRTPTEEILKKAVESKAFPTGPFFHLEQERLSEEIASLKENLATLNITEEEIYPLEFDERFESLVKGDTGWKMPPLKVAVKGKGTVFISGRIETASSKGLILYEKEGTENLIKNYPLWLVYCCLVEQHRLPLAKDALMVRDGAEAISWKDDEDSFAALGEYASLYFEGLQSPSPLLPKCVEHLLEDRADKAEDVFRGSTDSTFAPTYDNYLKWIKRTSPSIDMEALGLYWKSRALKVFNMGR